MVRYTKLMLYTGKGDKGTTTFGCDQRFSKSSVVAETLGTVDELNAFLGICKVRVGANDLVVGEYAMADIIGGVQQDLFIIQAQLAGTDKRMEGKKVTALEGLIGEIEQMLPPIHSFSVSGGTESAALLDTARAIARRTERAIVAFYLERDATTVPYGQDATRPDLEIHETALAYANRLSSLLFALARLANHLASVSEETPRYQ